MIRNQIKPKLQQNMPVYGISLCYSFHSADLIEFSGRLGFEFVYFDAEHSPIGRETCADLVRACDVVGLTSILRVPENHRPTILAYLETGVTGILVPHASTPQDAENAVAAVKFSPLGKRSAGLVRPADYGISISARDYFARANEQTMVGVLIEDHQAIENLDRILAVDGLDFLTIGPADLACSLGRPGESSHPDLVEMVRRAEDQIVRSGKILLTDVANAIQARQAVTRGARMVALNLGAWFKQTGSDFLAEVAR